MISTKEATNLILREVEAPIVEEVSLIDSFGKVLQEQILADRDFPPFDRVAMDGIAVDINGFNTQKGIFFKVDGIQASGAPPLNLTSKDKCIEVMTGAVLPGGCNCVIPYEQVNIEDEVAKVDPQLSVSEGMNIHSQGSDKAVGEVLLDQGVMVYGPQIAVAASVGKTILKVGKRPVITILSTGDELVPVQDTPMSFQIRASNSYALESVFKKLGVETVNRIHVKDDMNKMEKEISNALLQSDFLILTGGVSKGKYDFVPDLLQKLKVQKKFHRVAQKPGKPLWFGVKDNGSKKFIFGLPGNPVAVMVCCYRYVLPCLNKWMGIGKISYPKITLEKKLNPKKPLTHFVPIKIHPETGRALPIKTNGSGDLVSLANSDGFVEMDENQFDQASIPLEYFPWK